MAGAVSDTAGTAKEVLQEAGARTGTGRKSAAGRVEKAGETEILAVGLSVTAAETEAACIIGRFRGR